MTSQETVMEPRPLSERGKRISGLIGDLISIVVVMGGFWWVNVAWMGVTAEWQSGFLTGVAAWIATRITRCIQDEIAAYRKEKRG